MFIDCCKNNGTDYLRVVESYRRKDKDGKEINRRRTVRNIGPLSRFDDGKPDYLKRLRQSFKDGKPLIESLSDLVNEFLPADYVTIRYDRHNAEDAFSNNKNIGYFLLDALYDALGIYDVLNLHKSRRKLEYDLNGLAKLLVFGRVLDPDSKLGTFEARSRYLFKVAESKSLKDMYRALDCLNEKADAIQKRMNLKIAQSIGRNTELCFYDVTNYYFEIGENDPDSIDESGAIKRGLRKKGVSKENRREPIVQMGLFIDDNGIPIGYRLFSGNNTDQTTLRPALAKTIDTMELGRVIVVADGGLNNGPNIAHLLDCHNGYILSKSTKKSDKTVKVWMLDDQGYTWNESRTFKVKSMIRHRKIKDGAGKSRDITEKLVCYWSKKHYDREVYENEKFIEYLNSVIANPDKLKDKQKKIEKFLVEQQVDKATGAILDTQKHLEIDIGKVSEYLDLLGYYTIMTSETDKSDREIIDKYHGLSRIEDSFRITKSNLCGRPVFVHTPEHINAHFLACFIALTMIRIIQYRILKSQSKSALNDDGWESGLSAQRLQDALAGWTADSFPAGYYRLSRPDSDLETILAAFGIDGYLRLPTVKDLHQLKLSFDRAARS